MCTVSKHREANFREAIKEKGDLERSPFPTDGIALQPFLHNYVYAHAHGPHGRTDTHHAHIMPWHMQMHTAHRSTHAQRERGERVEAGKGGERKHARARRSMGGAKEREKKEREVEREPTQSHQSLE